MNQVQSWVAEQLKIVSQKETLGERQVTSIDGESEERTALRRKSADAANEVFEKQDELTERLNDLSKQSEFILVEMEFLRELRMRHADLKEELKKYPIGTNQFTYSSIEKK